MRNRTKKFINAYTFIVICMNVLIIGCFEDKGNYEYSELNEIHIDTLASPWRVDFQEEVILLMLLLQRKVNTSIIGY